MSTASYERIPTLPDYASAKRHYDRVKPMRGTTVKPLGDRRRHMCMYMEQAGADGGDIVLFHYKTPMITFHQPKPEDGGDYTRVTIVSPKHRPSKCDGYYIYEVLAPYLNCAGVRKGVLAMVDRGENRHLLPAGEHRQFVLNRDNRTLTPTDDHTNSMTGLIIDRRAANAVRKRYGEFYRYMKGMLGVRRQELVHENRWGEKPRAVNVVLTSFKELAEVVPTRDSTGSGKVPTRSFDLEKITPLPNQKPPVAVLKQRWINNTEFVEVRDEEPHKLWLANTQALLNLMTAPADDLYQHDMFRQAFVWLMFLSSEVKMWRFRSFDRSDTVEVLVDSIRDLADEVIFKYHSDEVFKTVALKPGLIPSGKYEQWITKQEGKHWW